MRRTELLLTADGATSVYPVNHYASNIQIGLAIDVIGSGSFTVQVTYDDVFAKGFDPSTAKWFDHPTLAAEAADVEGVQNTPCTGIRMTGTGVAGGGARLIIVPAAGQVN